MAFVRTALAPDQTGSLPAALCRLTLQNFRCYDTLRLDLDTRPVVLFGPNGAGKTNVLEAISFLAPGRGLRRARLPDVGRSTAADDLGLPWGVSARLLIDGAVQADDAVDIGTGYHADTTPEATRAKRRVRVDGQDHATQSVLSDILSVQWLTPQMDRLFMEGPSARRRFLDRMIFAFDGAHAARVQAYDHALRERLALLAAPNADAVWLDRLETTIAEKGVAVVHARMDLAERLDRACRAAQDTAFPAARISVVGTVEDHLRDQPALKVEDHIREQLATNRQRDAATGRTDAAPHRGDVMVRFLATNRVAADCSTGEQKALLIGLVLAHAELLANTTGRVPILLLDEIAAHLDANRRAALFDRLTAMRAQAWLTGTDAEQFATLGNAAQFIAVAADHTVSPVAAPPKSATT